MDLNGKQYDKVCKIIQENRSWIDVKSNQNSSGWCGISAVRVNYCLKKAGFRPKLIYVNMGWEAHCFNELGGYILDVTADQFDEQPIVIVRIDELDSEEQRWFWGFNNRDDCLFNDPIIITTGLKRCLKKLKKWNEMSPQHIFKRHKQIIAA